MKHVKGNKISVYHQRNKNWWDHTFYLIGSMPEITDYFGVWEKYFNLLNNDELYLITKNKI
jgi:hypothetical protein